MTINDVGPSALAPHGAFVFFRDTKAPPGRSQAEEILGPQGSELEALAKQFGVPPGVIPEYAGDRAIFTRVVGEWTPGLKRTGLRLKLAASNRRVARYEFVDEYGPRATGKVIGELVWRQPGEVEVSHPVGVKIKQEYLARRGRIEKADWSTCIRTYFGQIGVVPFRTDGRVFWAPAELMSLLEGFGKFLLTGGQITLISCPALPEHTSEIREAVEAHLAEGLEAIASLADLAKVQEEKANALALAASNGLKGLSGPGRRASTDYAAMHAQAVAGMDKMKALYDACLPCLPSAPESKEPTPAPMPAEEPAMAMPAAPEVVPPPPAKRSGHHGRKATEPEVTTLELPGSLRFSGNDFRLDTPLAEQTAAGSVRYSCSADTAIAAIKELAKYGLAVVLDGPSASKATPGAANGSCVIKAGDGAGTIMFSVVDGSAHIVLWPACSIMEKLKAGDYAPYGIFLS